MALLGGSGHGPNRTPVDDRRWNEAAAEFEKLKRRSKYVLLFWVWFGIATLMAVVALALLITSDQSEPAHDVAILLMGLAQAFVWSLGAVLFGIGFYQVVQTAVVTSSRRSRRNGAILGTVAGAPCAAYGLIIALASILGYGDKESAATNVLGQVAEPVLWMTFTVPLLMCLWIYPSIKRSDAIRAAQKSGRESGR